MDSLTRFARDGRGAPGPVAAPQDLVVTDHYQYVRNICESWLSRSFAAKRSSSGIGA